MMTDAASARAILIEKLRRDAALHRQGRFKEIGEGFDDLDNSQQCYDIRVAEPAIGTAWNFWEAWIDERNHSFPDFHRGITRDAWPVLAERLVQALAQGEAVADPVIVSHFVSKPRGPSLLSRWKRLFARR